MAHKHSASLEMLSYLKSYAAKRAERKGTESIAAPKPLSSMSYAERVNRLERKLARLQAQKMSDLLALADHIAPKTDQTSSPEQKAA